MRLKGIKGIDLLVAAALLLIALMGAIAAAGGEERRIDVEDFNWDARYWWEAPPLTPYERQQVKEIMVLILDRYFGTDVSAMSPAEFEELGESLGPEREKEVLRLFERYAEKRGFEIPPGLFEMPVEVPAPDELIPPAGARYWWELVDPEYRENAIAFAKKHIPEMLRYYWQLATEEGFEVPPGMPRPEEVDVMRLTPEEYALILNPPLPPLRLLTIEGIIEEMKGRPWFVAAYGRIPSYNTQTEIREWLDRLRELKDLIVPPPGTPWILPPATGFIAISSDGYLDVGLNRDKMDKLRINEEALALAFEIYALISERAETLGMQDVPVLFTLTRTGGLDGITAQPHQVIDPEITAVQQAGYRERYRPIIGGILMTIDAWGATVGFAVRDPIPWWPDDLDYVITGHLGPPFGSPSPVNTQVYQPTVGPGNEAGRVEDVASMNGFADVARVAIHNSDVDPYIHVGDGAKVPVKSWRDPHMHEWVIMSGVVSGYTQGRVLQTGVTLPQGHNPAFGALRNQFIAAYARSGGDSGAPIFSFLAGWEVEIFGIHVGSIEHHGVIRPYFSPTSGVRVELPGWYPYTKSP
ncbi:MAG: hypothetical protein DDT26_01056 [Dehalococcoidia bacterium]|nr:hypothetical protein [Chloroflexota bacterium]